MEGKSEGNGGVGQGERPAAGAIRAGPRNPARREARYCG